MQNKKIKNRGSHSDIGIDLHDSKLRKVYRIGPDRTWFEREVRKVIRRPGVMRAVLLYEEAGGEGGQIYLNGMAINTFLGMVERAKFERLTHGRGE